MVTTKKETPGAVGSAQGANQTSNRQSQHTANTPPPQGAEAARFLAALAPGTTHFTFQTFDDVKDRKDKSLARILHGTLAEHWDELVRLNAQGAGIFVTVNETDLAGRATTNIINVRALFTDLDGAPLAPVLAGEPTPHIIVESSPDKWHVYWRAHDIALDEFRGLQKALAQRFGGDPQVSDLPRVMRLPGFVHQKGEPFVTRVMRIADGPAYTAADFPKSDSSSNHREPFADDAAATPWRRLNSAALANLAAWVPELFPAAREQANGGYRVSSKALGRRLQEDLSLHPDGIKDWGIADQGDEREGRRTAIDIVLEYGEHKDGYSAAAWLRERLGIPDRGWRDYDEALKEKMDYANDAINSNYWRGRWKLPPRDRQQEEANREKHQEQSKKKKDEKQQSESTPVDLWAVFEPPLLPRGLLPEIIEQFAITQGAMMGADPSGLAAGALAVCAAVIPDHVMLQPKKHDRSWTESARLWVALIGDPATKKTPTLRQAVRPLTRIDARMWDTYRAAKARYDALPTEERKATPPPRQPRLRLEDTTIEAAQEVLSDNPDGLLCVQDELGGWFGSMDKYSGHRGAMKDRGFWLQAWNGGSYVINRITRGTSHIPNLSVCVLGGIQPDAIRKIAAESVDDGLLQRLLPIVLRPATLGEDAPTATDVRKYEELIERLHERYRDGTVLVLDDEALAIRRQLEQKHLDLMHCVIINKKLAAHIGKYDGVFARLCVLWHCVENLTQVLPHAIPARTAQRVADFLHTFLLPHAVAFYGGMLGLSDEHDRLQAVAGYILARGLQEVTNRDIQRGDRTMRGLGKKDMAVVFEHLEALGWIGKVPGPRPSDPPHWQVNPECHRLFAERAKKETAQRKAAREMIQAMLKGKHDART